MHGNFKPGGVGQPGVATGGVFAWKLEAGHRAMRSEWQVLRLAKMLIRGRGRIVIYRRM